MAGLTEVPVLVRQMDDDAATVLMVDSNLQRENILPSERAYAYKMKLEAMKRTAGRPSKENVSQVGTQKYCSISDFQKSSIGTLSLVHPFFEDMVRNVL